MKPYYQESGITIYAGDCLEVMPTLEPESVDAVITDPPYGLLFMGMDWDHGVPGIHLWQEVLWLAKPGAHLLAFGGTRTSHRLVCAIEDAGWEIRDTIMWVYGSGFPKSLDVSKAIDKEAGIWRGQASGVQSTNGSMNGPNYGRTDKGDPATEVAKQWDGWGTALKPAVEPICLARKPLTGTVAQNVQRYGTGALNIDASRIGIDSQERIVMDNRSGAGYGTIQCSHAGREIGERFKSHSIGRWPANLILSYPDDEYELRDDVTPAQLRALAEWMDANA